MNTTKFYAVYLQNGPIYGVGQTKEQAWNDAKEWASDLDCLKVDECTKEIFDNVTKYGGDMHYTETDNGLV